MGDNGVGRPVSLNRRRAITAGLLLGMGLAAMEATVVGTAPSRPVVFRERGLTMAADVVSGHKTGHFLDQRDNRGLVRAAAEGCRVLDVFSATGGFALAPAARGATSVHLVDVSQPALDTAVDNI